MDVVGRILGEGLKVMVVKSVRRHLFLVVDDASGNRIEITHVGERIDGVRPQHLAVGGIARRFGRPDLGRNGVASMRHIDVRHVDAVHVVHRAVRHELEGVAKTISSRCAHILAVDVLWLKGSSAISPVRVALKTFRVRAALWLARLGGIRRVAGIVTKGKGVHHLVHGSALIAGNGHVAWPLKRNTVVRVPKTHRARIREFKCHCWWCAVQQQRWFTMH